jgi:hypothetical protein
VDDQTPRRINAGPSLLGVRGLRLPRIAWVTASSVLGKAARDLLKQLLRRIPHSR